MMLKAVNEKNRLEAVEEIECSMIHWKRRKLAFFVPHLTF